MGSPFRFPHPDNAVIERQIDEELLGRIGYRVSGRTADIVQLAIAQIMNAPRVNFSEFTRPVRLHDGSYGAVGYTLALDEAHA